MFHGAIIKETITDEFLLDELVIERVEICKTSNAIHYWTSGRVPTTPTGYLFGRFSATLRQSLLAYRRGYASSRPPRLA